MDCRVPWEAAWVGLDGTVSFCCYQRVVGAPLILGNLHVQPLEEILNGPLATAIRNQMENELLPGACRCCPIYESERAVLQALEERHADVLAARLDDETWLAVAYQAMLGRPPDEGGRRFFLDSLRAGRSRLWVLRSISKSDEYREASGHAAGA